MRRNFVAGNWKMNGLRADLTHIISLEQQAKETQCDVVFCLPSTLISEASAKVRHIKLGGQDCHTDMAGAYTGDISASMLKDAGADYVIVGHSERRANYNETDAIVAEKTMAIWNAGLRAIVCCGESLTHYKSQETLSIVGAQLEKSIPPNATADNIIIAYEPIWAIGTGLVPSIKEIKQVHDFIRSLLCRRFGSPTGDAIRILYGGSLNPQNVKEIISIHNVDGGLVGGASLKATEFSHIIDAIG